MTTLKITETDTLKAHWAGLPIVSAKLDFLVKVMEPIELVPVTLSITHAMVAAAGTASIPTLMEKIVMEYFKGQFSQENPEILKDNFMWNIEKIELVECDLLVPKVKL